MGDIYERHGVNNNGTQGVYYPNMKQLNDEYSDVVAAIKQNNPNLRTSKTLVEGLQPRSSYRKISDS